MKNILLPAFRKLLTAAVPSQPPNLHRHNISPHQQDYDHSNNRQQERRSEDVANDMFGRT
jgi:hypothetical protein